MTLITIAIEIAQSCAFTGRGNLPSLLNEDIGFKSKGQVVKKLLYADQVMHYLTNLLNLSGQRKIDWTHQQDMAEIEGQNCSRRLFSEDQLPSACGDLLLAVLIPSGW